MKDKKQAQNAQYFRYKFTKTLLTLALLVLLLCSAGIAVSVYRLQKFGVHGFIEALQSPLLIFVCLLCICLTLSILLKSQYVVTKEYYITQFGVIKSKFPIKEITAISLNTQTKKLTVYIGEEFSVLSLAEQWQDEFIAALRKNNPSIEFTYE